MKKHGFPDDCDCASEDICQFLQRRESTPPAPLGEDALPVVCWRIKHPSEPGMLGHYPWSYSERATKRVMGFDEEPLVRHSDAEAQLSTLRDQVARLERELAQAIDERGERQAWCADESTRNRHLQRELDALKAAPLDVEKVMGLAEKYAIAYHDRRMRYTAETEHDCDVWSEALRAALTAKEPT